MICINCVRFTFHTLQGMDEDKGPQARKLYVEVTHHYFSFVPFKFNTGYIQSTS